MNNNHNYNYNARGYSAGNPFGSNNGGSLPYQAFPYEYNEHDKYEKIKYKNHDNKGYGCWPSYYEPVSNKSNKSND